MQYLLIALGGAIGSIARFKLGEAISKRNKSKFPYGTFIINISGAFLLGIVTNAGIGKNLSLLFADGFLGAYTTFSTFMYEGVSLFNSNKKLNAAAYIVISLVTGVLAFLIGSMFIKMFV